jgi:hypothetical protein
MSILLVAAQLKPFRVQQSIDIQLYMSIYIHILISHDVIDLDGLFWWQYVSEHMTIMNMIYMRNVSQIDFISSPDAYKILILSQFIQDILSFVTGYELLCLKQKVNFKTKKYQ